MPILRLDARCWPRRISRTRCLSLVRRSCLLACCATLAWTVSGGLPFVDDTCANEDKPPDALHPKADTSEFVATVLDPCWRSTILREPILFIEGSASERPRGKLFFKPTDVLSVTTGIRDVRFDAAKDFIVECDGTITLPTSSRIASLAREQLYPLMTSNSPKIARKAGDRTRGIFFDEGSAYHQLQTEVTYRHEPGEWSGPTPKYAGALLPKTIAALGKQRPVRIVLCGDSISLGANSSLRIKSPPGCPSFGELTALALENHFGGSVIFENEAVDGATSRDALRQSGNRELGKHSPPLVIIAFGMNDAYYGHDVDEYKANIRTTIEGVRAKVPDAEFILVASMLPNAERGIPLEIFWLYRDALAELRGPGVALADVTSIWAELLKRKSFYDLTGNGVNHPNDFGHCVYAQTLLDLLIDAPKQIV
jgi:acyl-CoA thioesterase I